MAIERCAKAGDFRSTFIVAGTSIATITPCERDIIAIVPHTDAGAGCGGVDILLRTRAGRW